MALAAQPDLSSRLRSSQRGLRARLERREALADLVRATQLSLDPQKVSEFLVRWTADWLPVNNWAVIAAEPGRELALIAERGLAAAAVPAAQAVAAWVTASNSDFFSADLSKDPRVSHPFAADSRADSRVEPGALS